MTRQSKIYTIDQAKVARISMIKGYMRELSKLSVAAAVPLAAKALNFGKTVATGAAANYAVDKGTKAFTWAKDQMTGTDSGSDPRSEFQQMGDAFRGSLMNEAIAGTAQNKRYDEAPIFKDTLKNTAKIRAATGLVTSVL